MQSRMSADAAGRVQIAFSVTVVKARIGQRAAVFFWTDIPGLSRDDGGCFVSFAAVLAALAATRDSSLSLSSTFRCQPWPTDRHRSGGKPGPGTTARRERR